MPGAVINHPSSYRDPSGFIFEKNGELYRQVNICFKEHFDHFIQSGCYDQLIKKNLLIPHEQIPENFTGDTDHYTTLKPQRISLITYPYEWSFDMLKDAALLTLGLAKEVLNYGMMLKDATPYNIQWHKGQFIFIDTLSFEKYAETPWIAYRQFCENFLGPLLLMHYCKMPLHQLQLSWPDGIPLAIIKSLLPKRSRFSLHAYLHIHLHAKVSSSNKRNTNVVQHFSKQKLTNLLSSLETLINKLKLPEQKSTWSGYYEEASKRDNYLEEKKKIIGEWLVDLKPSIKTAADIGTNEGEFSKLLAGQNIEIASADFDPFCINRLYLSIKKTNEKNIQPLILDISNPSPALGVNNEEKSAFISRPDVDLVLALALIHHLIIGKNIPFEKVAKLFATLGNYLIIEFVPDQDEKAKFLIAQKSKFIMDYNKDSFESSFKKYFTIEKQKNISGSQRSLYLLKKR
ncbi:hypothetical protein [Terrimonas pollutisoli]|uniref:hypothetical protein n=1 Tax=Terrimonas pollutisoli TaxID=3034147 RepID=UPI0023ED9CD4|nr:hypothetical protein [Terrimonas sp. H1YJ31]